MDCHGRVVILGSMGYLGSALTTELTRAMPDRPLIRARGVGELSPTRGRPSDVVINCVGYYGSDRARLRSANVDHVREVALYARRTSANVIHVSSSAVFDGLYSGSLDEAAVPL